MAYSMQLGAFVIFIRRVNLIYVFNQTEHDSIWQAIKASLFLPVKSTTIKVDTARSIVEAFTPLKNDHGTLSNDQLSERLRNLEKSVNEQFNQFNEHNKLLKKNLERKIQVLENKKDREKQVKANFDKKNAGPEIVAVLWLLIAAFTFFGTHIWDNMVHHYYAL